MSATIEVTNSEDLAQAPCLLDEFLVSPYLRRKRLAVRATGVLLGLLLAPAILVLVAMVRMTSPGPGLYRQRRVGIDGHEFTIYKLRSMREDAEHLSGPKWAEKDDPRITPLGHFLRYTHLDELPQIINVIRGEMDFVGPRPERPEFVIDLAAKVHHYGDRLEALPGVTGIAQVNLEPDVTIECVRRKLAADRFYIANASLWLDLRLIGATILRIFGIRYHRGAKLLGVTLPASVLQVGSHNQRQGSGGGETAGGVASGMQDTIDDGTVVDVASLQDTVVISASEHAASLERAGDSSRHRIPR